MKICWAQYLQWALFAVLALAILLSGCGQTGPLVLPGKAPAQTTNPPAKQTQTQPQSPNP